MDAARLQQLVAETAWLRRLARSLVGDAAADDVVQETYLVAAERAPDDRPIEPWLARVARNLARMRGRSAARRSARELATGDDIEAAARPDQLVERVETQRLLTNFVLELGEPYRDVILLHFFEGLSSAAIARRLGIPDGTVRWRLKHARDDLRARFDAREDRKAWLAPMAALAHTATPVAGVLVMKKLIAIAIALILLAMVVVAVYRRGDRTEDASTSSGRSVVAIARSSVPTWVVQADAPARRIAGHVLFAGAAVSGATVALRAAAQPDVPIADVATAADGSFAFTSAPPADYAVVASAPGRSPAIAEIDTKDPRTRPDQLVLVLGSCTARAVGTVTDAQGAPIVKARLRVSGLVGVDTGVDGTYELCLPYGKPTVTVSADGYGTVMALFEFQGMQHRDFVLVPEGVIVGRVVRDGDATRVADAQVLAVSADNPIDTRANQVVLAPTSTRSDADGRFQISGLSPGRFHVSATAPGLGSALVETIVQAGTSREVLIVVTARSRVHGRVVAGGEPVAGAVVTAAGAANLALASPVVAQLDGSFVLDGAPRGAVRWRVRGYDVTSPTATMIDKAEVRDVVLEVQRGAVLRGRVTMAGKPVVDAEVQWGRVDWSHGFGKRHRSVRSGADGTYMFDDIEPGECRVIAGSDSEGAFSDDHNITVAPNTTTDLDIDLVESASVTGTVVDENGAQVPSVAVALAAIDGEDQAQVVTDATGAFRVTAMPAGDFVPKVLPEGNADAGAFEPATGTAFPPIHVADRTTAVTGVRLAIKFVRLTISGRVVDDRGSPMPDVRIEISDMSDHGEYSTLRLAQLPVSMLPNPGVISQMPSTVTDGAGTFVLRGLVHARYDVRATGADGGNTTIHDVEGGATGVGITLARSGSIDGTLAGFGPAPSVMANDALENLRLAAVEGTTFSITGLRAGPYTVTAKDTAGADVRTVNVVAGETAHVDLHAAGTGRIEGRIVNYATGAPLTKRCFASPGGNGFAAWWNFDAAAMSDASGHFTIDPAPAGLTRVICMGEARSQRDVTVPANGTTIVELASVPLTPKGSNAGFAMLEDQNPPTIAMIDPKGAAAAAGLAVGDQIVSIDGNSVDSFGIDGLAALLDNHAPGTTAMLVILRGSTRLSIALVLR